MGFTKKQALKLRPGDIVNYEAHKGQTPFDGVRSALLCSSLSEFTAMCYFSFVDAEGRFQPRMNADLHYSQITVKVVSALDLMPQVHFAREEAKAARELKEYQDRLKVRRTELHFLAQDVCYADVPEAMLTTGFICRLIGRGGRREAIMRLTDPIRAQAQHWMPENSGHTMTADEAQEHWRLMLAMFCQLLPHLDDDTLDEILLYPYTLNGTRIA